MRFSKEKCEVLPWEGVVLGNNTDWALTGGEQLCCKGRGGPGERQAEAEGPTAPGVCEQKQSQ